MCFLSSFNSLIEAWTIGTLKIFPAAERMAFGENSSVQSPNSIMPSMSKAAAVRIIVPKFPASFIESSRIIFYNL